MKKLVREQLNEGFQGDDESGKGDGLSGFRGGKEEKSFSEDERSLLDDLMDVVQKHEEQGLSEKEIVSDIDSFYETMQASYDWYADEDDEDE